MTLGVVVFRSLSCLFFTSGGLERGWHWRCRFPSRVGLIDQFQCRLFLRDRALIFWRSCRFLGAMLRASGGLPGGLGRFLPCRLGANHCGPRPLEASGTGFWDDLLSLFGYPSGSGQSLVDGSLRMRYCSNTFSNKKPTSKLQPFGGVAALVAAAAVPPLAAGLRGSGDAPSFRDIGEDVRKRIRLTKQTNVRKPFFLC